MSTLYKLRYKQQTQYSFLIEKFIVAHQKEWIMTPNHHKTSQIRTSVCINDFLKLII